MQKSMAIFLLIISCAAFTTGCAMMKGMKDLNVPHYELGEHAGAAVCGDCHADIYAEWQEASAHATATSSINFGLMLEEFRGKFLLNLMMDEQMCFACHGDQELNVGIDCETCHGPVLPGASMEETHELKYVPERARLQAADFCHDCHSMESGTGDLIFSLFPEWEQSPAGQEGVTCQGCHMAPSEGGDAYHGFDSLLRVGVDLYSNQLALSDIRLDSGAFKLAIENKVTGHAVPATGPSRFLVLDISFLDLEGTEIHAERTTFGKFFKVIPLMGLFPHEQIKNTQLQAGETRQLEFTLPADLTDKIHSAQLKLRFMDVADWFEGDLDRAHWVSDVVLTEQTDFNPNLGEK